MRRGSSVLVAAAAAVAMVATMLPAAATHDAWTWWLRDDNTPGLPDYAPFPYGNSNVDWPLPGNWDGSTDPGESDDPGVARAMDDGHWKWFLRSSKDAGPADAVEPFEFGSWQNGDIPIVGDWDGINASPLGEGGGSTQSHGSGGTDTIGVVRPLGNCHLLWLLRNMNEAGVPDVSFEFGNWCVGDFPVKGDWTNDGDDRAGVVRPNPDNGRVGWLLDEQMPPVAPVEHDFEYGNFGLGDYPVVGDWDGAGSFPADSIGVARPSPNGRWRWLVKNTLTAGGPDPDPGPYEYGNWTKGDFPIVGNWDATDGGFSNNDWDTPGVTRPPQ